MTHAGAHGFHPHQERVRVAVHAQLAHPQPVAASCAWTATRTRSEEHTSELQSLRHLVCRLLLEKKKQEPVQTDRELGCADSSTRYAEKRSGPLTEHSTATEHHRDTPTIADDRRRG